MTDQKMLTPEDLDVELEIPAELVRVVEQDLMNLAPWRIMPRELALKRMRGLRERYATRYVPFARRQDSDDLACLEPARPGEVAIVHDFSSAGSELRNRFPSFWDWFRAAVEDMISFE